MNKESFKNEMIQDKNFIRTEQLIRLLRLSIFMPGLGQDVIIETNNKKKKLYGYSSILSARSPTFAAYKQNKLELEYNYEVVKTALEFIYTSNCEIPIYDPNEKEKTSFDLTCDLLSLAKYWALYEVKFQCEQYIFSELEKKEEVVKSGKDESNQIKNQALKKLNYIDNLNLQIFSDKILCIIDKQMEDIIKNKDYLYISDSNLRMILCRDTLNISREFQILQLINNYITHKFPVQNQNQIQIQNQNQIQIQNQNQIEKEKEKEKENQNKASILLKNDLIKFVRFGTMDFDEFLQIEKLDLLTEEEINDISDFIENKLDGNDSKNQKIIEKYTQKKEIHWFKNERVYFDSNTIISFENEEISKNINPKNADKNEGIADFYSSVIERKKNNKEGWIDEDIFKEMKLQFVSKKEDKLTCKDFHQICDNKAPILVIIESEENIFGGYSSVGWKKPEKQKPSDFYNDNYFDDINYIEDEKAFLFVLRSYKGIQSKIELFPDQKSTSIVYYSQRGPIFGDGWDLAISGNLKTGYSNPGHTYQLPDNIEFNSKEAKMFFTRGFGEWEVNKLEVYF
ncbi:e3 ubiquitin-protein ligase [Anaeramoeba ignava]|uniref:E3 ubiquitin-protein ligase n=1 Tax=Anaeramoeba ignava TaxID=1746090 RepID=A0A9Q0RAM6_ANAIG|nr:e3 ubiquitin-protein ligase [Anaeramoeba ignava]